MLVRQIAGLLVIAGAGFGATSGIDPNLLNLAMPDTKVLAGVNVTTAKTSPLGQFLISQIQGTIPQLQGAIAVTGFNPFTDVTQVLMAGVADPAKPGWLLLMDGAFNASQIAAAIQAQAGQNQSVQTYAGATLVTFTAPNGKPSPAVAFIGTGVAVAGDVASVEAALDRASTTNSLDPGLIARANALSGESDAWMVSIAPVASLFAGSPAAGGGMAGQVTQMLSSIQGFSGAVNLGANVQLAVQAVASSEKNAEALGDVARLVVSLGTMDASKDPQMAGLIQLLQQMQISTSGSDLNLALALPEAQVESLLKSISLPGKLPNGN